MPPAPTANQGFKTSSAPVMPPLPPMSGLSIFDDSTTETPNSRDCDSMESKSDSESEAEIAPPTHPDDVLNGELLRTTDAMNSKTRSDSFYLVYNNRAKLIKVGVTLYTYEECSQKYTKLYGHLDNFHFLKIENGRNYRICPLFINMIIMCSNFHQIFGLWFFLQT